MHFHNLPIDFNGLCGIGLSWMSPIKIKGEISEDSAHKKAVVSCGWNKRQNQKGSGGFSVKT